MLKYRSTKLDTKRVTAYALVHEALSSLAITGGFLPEPRRASEPAEQTHGAKRIRRERHGPQSALAHVTRSRLTGPSRETASLREMTRPSSRSRKQSFGMLSLRPWTLDPASAALGTLAWRFPVPQTRMCKTIHLLLAKSESSSRTWF